MILQLNRATVMFKDNIDIIARYPIPIYYYYYIKTKNIIDVIINNLS